MQALIRMRTTHIQAVLDFWFKAEHQAFWFQKSTDFDHAIQQQFADLHHQASQSELWTWRTTAEGRLAEILILDQFSRNLFRGDARSFAQDTMAVALCQEAIACGADLQLVGQQRKFLYMPLMHSESAKVHELAVEKFQQLGDALTLDFEMQHKAIIDRFQRYPHRNQVLGRVSTVEEVEFLKTHHGF